MYVKAMMKNAVAQAVGIGIGAVPVLFLVFDTWIGGMQSGQAKETQGGYPVDSALTVALLMLVCITVLIAGHGRRRPAFVTSGTSGRASRARS